MFVSYSEEFRGILITFEFGPLLSKFLVVGFDGVDLELPKKVLLSLCSMKAVDELKSSRGSTF
jgi:hypothetical protein